MKVFYTERDIETMFAQGVTEIEVDDNVVITDLAQDKARALGIKMKKVKVRAGPPMKRGLGRIAVASNASLLPATRAEPAPADTDPAAKIKAAVIARLGTTQYNDLLDRLIPTLLARLK